MVMGRDKRAAALLLAFSAVVSCVAWGAPTLVEHVQGYSLAANRLETFSGLVFEDGKVLAVGDAAELHQKYANATLVEGHGKTLLPGLIDAHGHVFDLGRSTMEIQLDDTRDLGEARARIRLYAAANAQRP